MDKNEGQPLWALSFIIAACIAAMFLIPIVDPPTPKEKLAAMPCTQRCQAQGLDDCYLWCGCTGDWSYLE